MNRSVWIQCQIVFLKNFLIYRRDKSALGDFLPPTLCFIFLYLASKIIIL